MQIFKNTRRLFLSKRPYLDTLLIPKNFIKQGGNRCFSSVNAFLAPKLLDKVNLENCKFYFTLLILKINVKLFFLFSKHPQKCPDV